MNALHSILAATVTLTTPPAAPGPSAAPPRAPATPAGASSAPPVGTPPRVIGGDPLEIPGRADGTTVLGERESAEAARAAQQAAAEPASEPPPSSDPRRRAFEELHLRLFPPPLTVAEVDAWCAALELGPDATSHARAVVEEYRARLRRFPPGEGLSLVVGSFQWSDQGERLVPLWSPVRMALLARRAEYLEALRGAESQLRTALLSLVVAERQAEARRLFFHRRFQIESPGEPGTLAGLDLASLVRECEFDPVDGTAIAPVLDAYIAEVEILFKRRLDDLLEIERQRTSLEMSLGPYWELVAIAEERVELAMAIDDLQAARGDLDGPLREATRRALLGVASRLTPAALSTFVDRLVLRLTPALFEEEVAVVNLLAAALAEPSLPTGGREGRLGFQSAVRLKLLPLGLEIADLTERLGSLPEARSGDLTIDRAAAVQRLQLESRRLEALRRRRAACIEAAQNLKMLLQPSEQRLLAESEQIASELRMRSSAETWMAQRIRDRIAEIMLRQAEAELAAEEAALEAQPAGAGAGGGESDGTAVPEIAPVGRGPSR